jgi:putative hydroxymethylpyrimidine transport system substrate-binding protein
MGIPIREFRVDEFGAPRYPELVVATSEARIERDRCAPDRALVSGLERGYSVMQRDPEGALSDLISQVPDLDRDSQQAQFDSLMRAHAWSVTDRTPAFTAGLVQPHAAAWVQWAGAHGVITEAAKNRASQGFVQISPSEGCE